MQTPEIVLERIEFLTGEWKLANLQPEIAACQELLHRRNGIDVAVFGRFKAGKSSFLNHLTGSAVLPIGVVPLTAVITRLRFSEQERAEVHFLNGTQRIIPMDEIGLYVSENENPNNQKQVASVIVGLPGLRPYLPLQFVDTPGLGSAFAHNTEVALNWLPKVGAALIAVSSDAPLSESDLGLLHALRPHTPRIALLLTKADLLTEAQRAEVLNFVRQQLRQKCEGELPIFFYSIQPGLSELKVKLQNDLFVPLLRARTEATGQILQHKLESLSRQTLDHLKIALAAATQAESARAELRAKVAEERRHFDLLRSELNLFAREQSAGALEGSLHALRPDLASLRERLTKSLDAQFHQWNLHVPSLLATWRQWLSAWLTRELAEVSRSQQTVFCAPVQRVRSHLIRTLQGFHDRLAVHVNSALGVTLPPHEFCLDVREPTAPPVNVAYAFDAAFTSVGWLIPMALFRKPIERALLRKARYEVEKNLSRLAADWCDRVGAVIEELRQQGEEAALTELASLESMLAQTRSDESRIRAVIQELEAWQDAFRCP